MGRTRKNQPPKEPEQGVSGKQVAVIATLLLTRPKPGELAAALLGLLPAALLARFPKVGATAALTAARLVLSTVGAPERNIGRSRGRGAATDGTLGIASGSSSRDEAVFSALYAIRAAQRLFKGREDFGAALDTERGYLALHRRAKERRVKAQRVADAMRDLYGDVLSWNWGSTRIPDDPRPSHRTADKKNVDLSKGVPIATGALAGALAGCTCAFGPPIEGAELLR